MPADEPATPALGQALTAPGQPSTALGQAEPVAGRAEAVSVPAAARRLGRTPDAIRGDIRRGKLTARRGNDGRLMVLLPPVAPVAVNGPSPDLDRLRDEVARLADELATARRRGRRRACDGRRAARAAGPAGG